MCMSTAGATSVRSFCFTRENPVLWGFESQKSIYKFSDKSVGLPPLGQIRSGQISLIFQKSIFKPAVQEGIRLVFSCQ